MAASVFVEYTVWIFFSHHVNQSNVGRVDVNFEGIHQNDHNCSFSSMWDLNQTLKDIIE
jgi:hypothetical protein